MRFAFAALGERGRGFPTGPVVIQADNQEHAASAGGKRPRLRQIERQARNNLWRSRDQPDRLVCEPFRHFCDLPRIHSIVVVRTRQPDVGNNGRNGDQHQDHCQRDEPCARRGAFVDREIGRTVEHDRQKSPVGKGPVRRQPVGNRQIDQRRQDERHQQQHKRLATVFVSGPGDVGQRGPTRPQRREKDQRNDNISRRADNITDGLEQRVDEGCGLDDACREFEARAVAQTPPDVRSNGKDSAGRHHIRRR